MNIEAIGSSSLVMNLGWTLLHSLWQITGMAILLFALLHVLRHRSANLRYLLSVGALACAIVIPVYTFVDSVSTANTHSISRTLGRKTSGEVHPSVVPDTIVNPTGAATAGSGHNVSTVSAFFSVLPTELGRNLPDLFPAAVLLWAIGVVFFSLRLCGGFWQLRRYRIENLIEADSYWQHTFAKLIERSGIHQRVRLYGSELIGTPIAVGVLKPMIIVPAALFMNVNPRELETVIAHELMHIRRYDPLVNIFQCVIEALLFYHPAVWIISARIRREREFAADAAVLEIMTNAHVTYARALANLEEIRLKANKQTPRYATAANGGNLMQRIQKILNVKTETNRANSAWTAGVAVLLTSALFAALFSVNSPGLVNAQKKGGGKKLAIGFVSIPPVDRTSNAPKDADATARLLIDKLKKYKVPAIGFLQGGMVSDGDKLFPVRANIARMWRDAGFEIGLGGFRHINLYDTPVDEYIANIEKNEGVAKKVLGDMALPPRYFSYPYLNNGRSSEDRTKVESWLAARGYTPVKYTFDNNEWMYSYAYDMARNDNDIHTMKEIRDQYLAYMGKMFDHYEAYSSELFGRNIPQTMVLTPSRLITDTADEFFEMATRRGYAFVSVNDAQADEAYKTPESYTGENGISWFERWSTAKGRGLKSEPEIDQLVRRIWDENHSKGKK